MALAPRIVIVHRRSELDELIDRHATYGQAEFFLRSRGRDIAGVQARHDAVEAARTAVEDAVPDGFRRAAVERSELDRYLFAPEDVIVVVGQDGLVANVAKYLRGQPVLGIDPRARASTRACWSRSRRRRRTRRCSLWLAGEPQSRSAQWWRPVSTTVRRSSP